MSARDRILARLRVAAPAQANALPNLAPILSQQSQPLTGSALTEGLQNFTRCLEAAHAEIVDARPSQQPNIEKVALLENFCKLKNIRNMLLPAGIKSLGDIPGVTLETFDRPIDEIKDRLFNDVDAGVTVAECGLVDTGMLVMRSSSLQPRTLSLVPPIHFCFINVNRLYADMRSAMAGEGWVGNMTSNLVFISGPSKTADIQQTLAYGAHGPKELIVILVEEDLL